MATSIVVIYAHGYQPKSYCKSKKALILSNQLNAITPALPPNPDTAISILDTLISQHSNVLLIGHSLGGFYVKYLAVKYNLPAIITNPIVCPQKSHLLDEALKSNDKDFKEHIKNQLALYDVLVTNPDNFLIMLQKGDAFLDYREARGFYKHCNQIILNGGDHHFEDFQYWIPIIQYFYKRAMRN